MFELPINLEDLIFARGVETARLEFKGTWNEPIEAATTKTICAFANDYYNLNGGYLIIGIDTDEKGAPILPPRGLEDADMEAVQTKIRGQCNRIDPVYQPLLAPAMFQDRSILVVWAPGGDNRPYQAPTGRRGERAFYVRLGPETVEAKGEDLRRLLELTAKVPFDDRKNLTARIEDISPTLVRRFLSDVKSELVLGGENVDDRRLYRSLRIVAPVNAHEVPRNVGLLFFNEDPERFFPGARIEIAQFADDAGGDLIEERSPFKGPLDVQARSCLDYVSTLSSAVIRKMPREAEVEKTVAYPYEALEEAVVNAVYHRSYDGCPEPTKIYFYPNRVEIISYPGPVPGILMEHLQRATPVPPVPARNRRIGEFLKERRLAEARGTGLPKIQRVMQNNGSPAPVFDFDDARTYFRVTLPVHPRYLVMHALRESARLWATGEGEHAIDHLKRAIAEQPTSGALSAQLIEYAAAIGDMDAAASEFERFDAIRLRTDGARPYLRWASVLFDKDQAPKAREVLGRIRIDEIETPSVAEMAILKKRAREYKDAHRLFLQAYESKKDDARFVHEFAQTKIRLASAVRRDTVTRRRLNMEAKELLRRALALSDQPMRQAWCWYDLARVKSYLGEPHDEIESAFRRAIELLPGERRFAEEYERWQARRP